MKINFTLLKDYFFNILACILSTIFFFGFYAMIFSGGPLCYNSLELFGWTYPFTITSICFGLAPIIFLILNLATLKRHCSLSVKNVLYNVLGIPIFYFSLILILKPGWTKTEEFFYTSFNTENIMKNNDTLLKKKISYVEDKYYTCQNQIIEYISVKYSIEKDNLIIKDFNYRWSKSDTIYTNTVSAIVENNLYPEEYFTVTADIESDGVTLYDYVDTYEELSKLNELKTSLNSLSHKYFNTNDFSIYAGYNNYNDKAVFALLINNEYNSDFNESIANLLSDINFFDEYNFSLQIMFCNEKNVDINKLKRDVIYGNSYITFANLTVLRYMSIDKDDVEDDVTSFIEQRLMEY